MTEQAPKNDSLEARLITPGQILKAARQAHPDHLSESDVAKKLHLSQTFIKYIENDQYDHFSAFIYLHGYLRAYARLVNVQEDKVLRALESVDLKKDMELSVAQWSGNNNASLPIYSRTRQGKSRVLQWFSVAVIGILILLVVMWWYDQQKIKGLFFSHRNHVELSNNKNYLPIQSKSAASKPNSMVSNPLVITSGNKAINKNSVSTTLPILAKKKQQSSHDIVLAKHENKITPSHAQSPQQKVIRPNYLIEPATQN